MAAMRGRSAGGARAGGRAKGPAKVSKKSKSGNPQCTAAAAALGAIKQGGETPSMPVAQAQKILGKCRASLNRSDRGVVKKAEREGTVKVSRKLKEQAIQAKVRNREEKLARAKPDPTKLLTAKTADGRSAERLAMQERLKLRKSHVEVARERLAKVRADSAIPGESTGRVKLAIERARAQMASKGASGYRRTEQGWQKLRSRLSAREQAVGRTSVSTSDVQSGPRDFPAASKPGGLPIPQSVSRPQVARKRAPVARNAEDAAASVVSPASAQVRRAERYARLGAHTKDSASDLAATRMAKAAKAKILRKAKPILAREQSAREQSTAAEMASRNARVSSLVTRKRDERKQSGSTVPTRDRGQWREIASRMKLRAAVSKDAGDKDSAKTLAAQGRKAALKAAMAKPAAKPDRKKSVVGKLPADESKRSGMVIAQRTQNWIAQAKAAKLLPVDQRRADVIARLEGKRRNLVAFGGRLKSRADSHTPEVLERGYAARARAGVIDARVAKLKPPPPVKLERRTRSWIDQARAAKRLPEDQRRADLARRLDQRSSNISRFGPEQARKARAMYGASGPIPVHKGSRFSDERAALISQRSARVKSGIPVAPTKPTPTPKTPKPAAVRLDRGARTWLNAAKRAKGQSVERRRVDLANRIDRKIAAFEKYDSKPETRPLGSRASESRRELLVQRSGRLKAQIAKDESAANIKAVVSRAKANPPSRAAIVKARVDRAKAKAPAGTTPMVPMKVNGKTQYFPVATPNPAATTPPATIQPTPKIPRLVRSFGARGSASVASAKVGAKASITPSPLHQPIGLGRAKGVAAQPAPKPTPAPAKAKAPRKMSAKRQQAKADKNLPARAAATGMTPEDRARQAASLRKERAIARQPVATVATPKPTPAQTPVPKPVATPKPTPAAVSKPVPAPNQSVSVSRPAKVAASTRDVDARERRVYEKLRTRQTRESKKIAAGDTRARERYNRLAEHSAGVKPTAASVREGRPGWYSKIRDRNAANRPQAQVATPVAIPTKPPTQGAPRYVRPTGAFKATPMVAQGPSTPIAKARAIPDRSPLRQPIDLGRRVEAAKIRAERGTKNPVPATATAEIARESRSATIQDQWAKLQREKMKKSAATARVSTPTVQRTATAPKPAADGDKRTWLKGRAADVPAVAPKTDGGFKMTAAERRVLGRGEKKAPVADAKPVEVKSGLGSRVRKTTAQTPVATAPKTPDQERFTLSGDPAPKPRMKIPRGENRRDVLIQATLDKPNWTERDLRRLERTRVKEEVRDVSGEMYDKGHRAAEEYRRIASAKPFPSTAQVARTTAKGDDTTRAARLLNRVTPKAEARRAEVLAGMRQYKSPKTQARNEGKLLAADAKYQTLQNRAYKLAEVHPSVRARATELRGEIRPEGTAGVEKPKAKTPAPQSTPVSPVLKAKGRGTEERARVAAFLRENRKTPDGMGIYANIPAAGQNRLATKGPTLADRSKQRQLVARLNTYERTFAQKATEGKATTERELHHDAMYASGLTEQGLVTSRSWAGKKASSKPGVFYPDKSATQAAPAPVAQVKPKRTRTAKPTTAPVKPFSSGEGPPDPAKAGPARKARLARLGATTQQAQVGLLKGRAALAAEGKQSPVLRDVLARKRAARGLPVKSAAPAPQPTPQPTTATVKAVGRGTEQRLTEAAIKRVDRAMQRSPGMKHNLASMEDLRKNLGGTRDRQDAMIRRARLADTHTMSANEGRTGKLTEGQRAAGIREGDGPSGNLTYISRIGGSDSGSPRFSVPARGTGKGKRTPMAAVKPQSPTTNRPKRYTEKSPSGNRPFLPEGSPARLRSVASEGGQGRLGLSSVVREADNSAATIATKKTPEVKQIAESLGFKQKFPTKKGTVAAIRNYVVGPAFARSRTDFDGNDKPAPRYKTARADGIARARRYDRLPSGNRPNLAERRREEASVLKGARKLAREGAPTEGMDVRGSEQRKVRAASLYSFYRSDMRTGGNTVGVQDYRAARRASEILDSETGKRNMPTLLQARNDALAAATRIDEKRNRPSLKLSASGGSISTPQYDERKGRMVGSQSKSLEQWRRDLSDTKYQPTYKTQSNAERLESLASDKQWDTKQMKKLTELPDVRKGVKPERLAEIRQQIREYDRIAATDSLVPKVARVRKEKSTAAKSPATPQPTAASAPQTASLKEQADKKRYALGATKESRDRVAFERRAARVARLKGLPDKPNREGGVPNYNVQAHVADATELRAKIAKKEESLAANRRLGSSTKSDYANVVAEQEIAKMQKKLRAMTRVSKGMAAKVRKKKA